MPSSRSPRLLERMGQFVGGLGSDGARGGVEADRLVAAGLFFQRLGQHVVDPDAPRVPLLGLGAAPTRPARGHPCVDQTGPQQVQADRAQGVVVRFLFHGLQTGQPGRLVGFVEGVAGRSARGQGRRSVRPGSGSLAPAAFLRSLRRTDAQSSRALASAIATAGGRALILALPPRPEAAWPRRSRPRGRRRHRRHRCSSRLCRRPWPSGCRPDDRAASCRARRHQAQPGFPRVTQHRGAAASSPAASAPASTAARATCQRVTPSGFFLAWSRRRDRLAHDPVHGRGLHDHHPGVFGPLLEEIGRAQAAQGGECKNRRRQRELNAARRRRSSTAFASATARSRSASWSRSWTPAR